MEKALIDKIPLNLLFTRLNSPSSRSLSLYKRCFSSFTILVALCYFLQ